MSRTNIEYLFQLTGLVAERTPSAPGRGGEDDSLFGDHLSLASATSLGEPSKAARPDLLAGGDSAGDSRRSSGAASDDAPSSAPSERPDDAAAANGSTNDDDQAAETLDQSPAAHEEGAVDERSDPSADDVANGDESESGEETADDYADAAAVATADAASQNAQAATSDASLNIAAGGADDALATESKSTGAALTNDAATAGRRAARLAAGASLKSAAESDATATTPTADVSAQAIPQEHHSAEHEVLSDESTTSATRSTKGGKRRVAAANAESQNQTTKEKAVTDDAKSNEAASTEPAASKEADEPRRGRNVRTGLPSASRADNAQTTGKVADAAIASGAPIQADHSITNGEATQDTAQVAKGVAAKTDALVATTGRLQPGNVALRRRGRTGGGDDLPRVDAARFVGRVAKAFQSAHERGGTLQLRLSPPELGSLRLELTVKDGVMTAALETENASARRVLLDHLPALRDRLAEQNIRVERFDVDVRRDGAGGQADPRAFQDQQQSPQDHPEQRRRPTAPPVAESGPQARPALSRTNNTGINLVA